MKKRVIICLLLCLTALVLVAGCSKKSDAPNSQATGTSTQNSADGSQPASSNQASQRPKADIFGQVKSLSGNDITIALAQIPQRDPSQSGKPPQNQAQNPAGGTAKGQGQRPNRTLQLTGESKTITIPDGAKIYGGGWPGGQNQGQSQSQSQSQGQGPKEITLKDIKTGDTISVYYKTGTTTVDHVSVRSGGQQQ